MSAARLIIAAAILQVWLLGFALEISFIDVGQGLSVLISSPSGQRVLYDAGPRGANVNAHLRRAGVTNLDLLIASHGHADHIGGMPDVIQALTPTFYMDNGVPHTTLTYERVLQAALNSSAQLLEPTRRVINLGEVRLQILPPPGRAEWEQNDNSIGVRIEYGEFAALLPGDAEENLWGWWVANHGDLLEPITVLQASHHGSKYGDTPEALALLKPSAVVISAGANNQYGHPHPEALNLYGNARVLRTDLQGSITIRARRDGTFEVSSTGASAAPASLGAPPTQPEGGSKPSAGCVDINTASIGELERIIHIGPVRAAEIVRLRELAPFASVTDLLRVSGIGAARLSQIVEQGVACVQ